ncbi:MAG: ferric reductase-like transmembrane domain-containing protein [Ilumatobacter sp.]
MTTIVRRIAGRPSDWQLRPPRRSWLRLPRPSIRWVGPSAIAASCAAAWLAFAEATGDGGNVALGLWVGAVSILLMAWSLVLALRLSVLERWFGGLDSMYRAHRWAGALSVPFMFWHTQIEPEIEGGVLGASRAVAEAAEELAGTGEVALYTLVALSALRWMPYRWWRWTHKLIGVPFAFACWHFFTAEKPYANGSLWGWFFGGFMATGLAAWIARVAVRDAGPTNARYRIASAVASDTAIDVSLEPTGHRLTHRAGQFAFIKLDVPGLREPHPFTIASGASSERLRFVIRDLGDWSGRLVELGNELVGADVALEGPYGAFEPWGAPGQRTVWVAGGVGITPFLAALDDTRPGGATPCLLYATRDRDGDGVLRELREAELRGAIDLTVFESSTGHRLTPDAFADVVGDLGGGHVALCGPPRLVADIAEAARELGAKSVETEDFDIRQGFGPDLSARALGLSAPIRRGAGSSSPLGVDVDASVADVDRDDHVGVGDVQVH